MSYETATEAVAREYVDACNSDDLDRVLAVLHWTSFRWDPLEWRFEMAEGEAALATRS